MWEQELEYSLGIREPAEAGRGRDITRLTFEEFQEGHCRWWKELGWRSIEGCVQVRTDGPK